MTKEIPELNHNISGYEEPINMLTLENYFTLKNKFEAENNENLMIYFFKFFIENSYNINILSEALKDLRTYPSSRMFNLNFIFNTLRETDGNDNNEINKN